MSSAPHNGLSPEPSDSDLGAERRDGVLSLHPDLARIAVRYQRVRSQNIQGQMSDAEANVALSELVARDDHGVQWSINPRDGGWQYLGGDNVWRPAEPPEHGIAAATAHVLDAAAGGKERWDNPDLVIKWVSPTGDPDSWDEALAKTSEPTQRPSLRPFVPAIIGVVVLALSVFAVLHRSQDNDNDPAPTIPAPASSDAPPPALGVSVQNELMTGSGSNGGALDPPGLSDLP